MLIGLVGKPSAGKSTFFKAATLAEVEIANYPFTTIKPNRGTGYVKVDCADKHFGVQCHPRFGYCMQGKRFVPIELLDVAGLVPGAHEGKGMGNQFLDDLRQADVLIHVVDISGSVNANGEPVPVLSYDPANDIQFLEEELDLWYFSILNKGWEKFARQMTQEKANAARALGKQLSGLHVTEEMVEGVVEKLKLNPEQPQSWTPDDLKNIAIALRKKTKPMIIACNKIDVSGAEKNYERLKEMFTDHLFVPCSAEAELALREAAKHQLITYVPGASSFVPSEKLNDRQSKALGFIQSSVLAHFQSTGVQHTLDAAVFEILKYMAIFPGGVNKLADQFGHVLPDCFLLPHESTALDFAYKLHTDLGKNFIRAIDVKTKKTVGKDHLLHHTDVVEIVSGK
ncbi:redox-regulated ATPase YchF [Candidatus Woesearchaeota archaeon]|nr:redox-regulated ATPase YchF [Candidatus Woesearchaeota archaeon]